jgi:hypothetical protein
MHPDLPTESLLPYVTSGYFPRTGENICSQYECFGRSEIYLLVSLQFLVSTLKDRARVSVVGLGTVVQAAK